MVFCLDFYSKRFMRRASKRIDEIRIYGKIVSGLLDDGLKSGFEDLRRGPGGRLSSAEDMACAFGVEALHRVLGIDLYDEQLLGSLALHEGSAVEMKTGEGKTYVSVLPALLSVMRGEQVFIVTVNDYLAERDFNTLSGVFGLLGISCGLILHDMSSEDRRASYACDVVFGTHHEFGFDYLRDNMAYLPEQRVQRGLGFAILDELDSVLLDEAQTPLVISGMGDADASDYIRADECVRGLVFHHVSKLDDISTTESVMTRFSPDGVLESEALMASDEFDCIVEDKTGSVQLTDRGLARVAKFYGLSDWEGEDGVAVFPFVQAALKAHGVYRNGVDYIIDSGASGGSTGLSGASGVLLVDKSTGRVLSGRRFSKGLHQALEAKEGVEVHPETVTHASITLQNFFRKFYKLAGMSGTLETAKSELGDVFGLPVVVIPTHVPVKRVDHADLIYPTESGKLRAVVEKIRACHEVGQPVLVGTPSVEASESLADLLSAVGIKYNLLNARYHELEAEIIAQAGCLGAVTIATNMAGRGTDILLGGNPEFAALSDLRKSYPEHILDLIRRRVPPNSTGLSEEDASLLSDALLEYKSRLHHWSTVFKAEREVVLLRGGLMVIGTERHSSRRVDDQLRGRAGRQGDPGESIFFLSLEDKLLTLMGADRVAGLTLGASEDVPIESRLLTGLVQRAQCQLESQQFQRRLFSLRNDNLLSMMRERVYGVRSEIIESASDTDKASALLERLERYVLHALSSDSLSVEDKRLVYGVLGSGFSCFSEGTLTESVCTAFLDVFHAYLNMKSFQDNVSYARKVLLFHLDSCWRDCMTSMEYLQDQWSKYAFNTSDPRSEYQREAFQIFDEMERSVCNGVLMTYVGVIRQSLDAGLLVRES